MSEPLNEVPLIDRYLLVDLVSDALSQAYTDDVDAAPMVSGAVLTYLLERLTPEALDPDQYDTDGTDLHRRIFGEVR